ncbi:MAG: hypothetical protein Q9170_003779 [Blastenia crenularia]
MLSFDFLTSNITATAQWLVALLIGYAILVVVRRLCFHPLAQIPGPKLAAATLLYQTFYCFGGGRSRFYQKIADWHEKYGMIIPFARAYNSSHSKLKGPIFRIGPSEVHLSDPKDYDQIYYVGSRYSKDAAFYGGFANPNSMFTTPSNELHRLRRSELNPFFSRKVVLDLEDIVQEKAQRLIDLLQEALASGKALDAYHGFRAVSIDVITDYAFGQSYGLLDQVDLGKEFFDLMQRLGPAAWIFRQWPWLKPVVMMMPEGAISFLSRPMGFVRDLQKHCRQQIREVIARRIKETASNETNPNTRPTIFSSLLPAGDDILNSTIDTIADEAYTVLTAAADTTGNAMTTITHYVLSDPKIYGKLHSELKTAFPDEAKPLRYQSLERLPYLSNVIKEGLRLSFGVPGRLPRVVPDNEAIFHGYTLPLGTVVSMSSWVMHHDEAYFPNPANFDPDRWIKVKEAQKMEKAFVPFGKGSRACIGMKYVHGGFRLSYKLVCANFFFQVWPTASCNNLSGEELAYDDYFSSYAPLKARKLHIMSRDSQGADKIDD